MEAFQSYWAEFLLLAAAHLAAVISPGPDFAIIMRQSLVYGRKTAIISSLGVGCAISIHLAYTLIAIELLHQSSAWVFSAIQIAGAIYLAYLGLQALRAGKAEQGVEASISKEKAISNVSAFKQGFFTNALNPKATAFFLFLFTSIVSPITPLAVNIFYGLWMVVITALWFILLSLILSQHKVRAFFASFGHWLDRGFGAILLALAALILINLAGQFEALLTL